MTYMLHSLLHPLLQFPLQFIFYLLLFIVFFTYLGYGMVLYTAIRIKRIFFRLARPADGRIPDEQLPEVTFLVAAYNEERWIEDKLRNSLALDYPRDKIRYYFVTDGSNDQTPELIRRFAARQTGAMIHLFHEPERKGKIAAVERVMPLVLSPIVVFTDANTDLNKEAVRKMVAHFANPKVGAVAGEKRVTMSDKDEAAAAGEGVYWKYESLLKKWDSEFYSTIGAAGELFAVRTNLYRPAPPDTLIEDFYITMKIAMQGYKIAYEPDAYAVEGHSASIKEELKRKIRIAAGALQAVWRLSPLLNPFRYGWLSLQYIAHRALRWTVAPLALPALFMVNLILAGREVPHFQFFLLCQTLFYGMALCGWVFERRKLKIKIFFVPYYFCIMNYAMYRGFFRLLSRRQSVVWEKAKRA